MDDSLKKEIALSKMLVGGVLGSLALFFLVDSALGTDYGVVLTNATNHEISLSQSYAFKGSTHTTTYRIPPGGSDTISVFVSRFVIKTGNIRKDYMPAKIPDRFAYTISYHGIYKEELVNATLKKDDCIYLSAAGSRRRNSDVPQPTGFPHCADIEPEVPPPAPPVVPEETKQKISQQQSLGKQMGEWSCPGPVGAERIRPLHNLAAEDSKYIREARERIELFRRKTNDSWDAAAAEFAFMQSDFENDYDAPATDKRVYLPYFKIDGYFEAINSYKKYKDEYDNHCILRNKGIAEMMADVPALESLRKESQKPWLREQNRLPCMVASARHCTELTYMERRPHPIKK